MATTPLRQAISGCKSPRAKGSVARISFGGKGRVFPAAYRGYRLVVERVLRGPLVIYSENDDGGFVQQVYGDLSGPSIEIYFKPSDPNVSFSVNDENRRFLGLAVT
jgi:hypothetical protein